MRFFVKNSVFGAVLCLSTSLFALSARAGCTQGEWESSTTECTVEKTTLMNWRASTRTGLGADQWLNVSNSLPVGAKKIINADMHFADGNFYFQSQSNLSSGKTPRITFGKDGIFYNSGYLQVERDSVAVKKGDLKISGGEFTSTSDGYVRILSGTRAGLLPNEGSTYAGDFINTGSILIGGGSFDMRAGVKGNDGSGRTPSYSVIGFASDMESVSVEGVAKLFFRGGEGTLRIDDGTFNITNDGSFTDQDNQRGYARIGTSKKYEDEPRKRTTQIYGGTYNIDSGTILLIEGDNIVIAKNPSGSNIPKFNGEGVLQIGSNTGWNLITISNGFTSTENNVKRVAFSGIVNLQTDEYFRELELVAGTFTFARKVNVRERFIQRSGSTIDAPTGVLELDGSTVTGDFNGKLILNTLAVRNGAKAGLTQNQMAGSPETVTITNVRVEDAYLAVYGNVATLQNLYMSGNSVLNAFEGLNLYNASFTNTTDDLTGEVHIPKLNLVSKKGSTDYTNATIILQSGTMTMDGRNLSAYTLDENDNFVGAGAGAIRLTGYANLITTGDVFGRGTHFSETGGDPLLDHYKLSVQVQYGTATINSAQTYLDSLKVIFRDETNQDETITAKTGGVVFNGANALINTVAVDQDGFLIVNNGATLEVTTSFETGENSSVSGAGTLISGGSSAHFKGAFAMGNATLKASSAIFESTVNVAGTMTIASGSNALFKDTARAGVMKLEAGTGTAAASHAEVTFERAATFNSLVLGDYAVLRLADGGSSLGNISYEGSNATLVLAKGETVMNTGTVFNPTGTGNGIWILKDAKLAVTNDFDSTNSPVAIYGEGTLRLVGGANAKLGAVASSDRLLYGLEIGSGTATVSTSSGGYYSLGKLTFTNEGQGTLALTSGSKLVLTDSLETKKGTKIDAADATIQLYCNGENCFSDVQTGRADLGGDAVIGTLKLSQGGLKVSGTAMIQNLDFKDASNLQIEIASGGVLNLGSTNLGGTHKIFSGEGTLNAVKSNTSGYLLLATGSSVLGNLNIEKDAGVNLTFLTNVRNTNIYDGGALTLNSYAYNVLSGGAFNLFENGTINWDGANSKLIVYGTANFNKATGSNATNKLVADGGTLNYNYTDQTASESVTLKNGATLNVNGTANFGGLKSEKSNASAGNSVLNVAGKLAQVNFVGSLIKDLTLTGTGTILAVSSVNLDETSKIDGLNVMQLQSNLTLNGNEHSLNALRFRNGGSSLTLNDDAVLNVYDKITFSTDDGYVNGDGTLRAKSGANFSVHTGIVNGNYLKNLHIEKGATVGIANSAVRSLIKNIKNEGVLSLADTDTLYTETVQSTGTISGEGKNLYLESAGNSVFSGLTTLQTLNVIAGGAVANLSGTLNIKDLYMDNGAAHILSDSFFDRIGTSHAGSNAKLTVSANVSTNEIYGSLKTGGDGVLTLTGTATDYSEITPDSLNRLIVGENQKVKFPAGTLKNADIAGEMLVESGKSVSFGTLNLAKGSTSEIGGTITVSNDFYLNPDAELTSNGTIRLNGANNVINKSGAIFAGTFDLGDNTATTFSNSAELTNLTTNGNSRVNLAQNKLVVNGTINVAGAAASPAMIAMKFTELDSESGVLDLSSGSLAGSGSLAFDVTVDYSAVASDRQEIKAVTGKNKSDFDAAGVSLPTHHNLRYRWDVKDSCTSGDGVCYSLTVIKTAEELAKEYSSNKNDAATAKGMLDDGLFTHAMSETYALASHLHNLSQTDGVNYVKALNAVSPDVSGARTWQANGMQNRVMGTLNSRMTALIPALTKAPEPVNWRARGRSGGSPYETRWMNRDRYRKAAGYEDYAPAPERASEMRRVNSSDYFGETASDAQGKAVDFKRGATKRTVPASEYYRQTYEPSKKAQESGYTKKYESADSYGVRKYREKKGRTVKDVNFGAWAQAFYAKSKIDGDSGFDGDATGFAFGFDGSVTEHLILGLGYSNTSSDADSGQHSLTTTNDAFFLYGMYKPDNWYYSGVLTYGSSDTDETADFTGGLKKTYSYGGSFISAQLMAGLDTQTPVSAAGGLRFTTLSTDSYERSGQKVSGFTSNTLTMIAEGRYAKDYMNETQDAIFRPEARLALTYDFVNKSENAQVTLPNNVTYRVEGEDVGKVGFELGLSASYNFTNTVEVSAGWDGEFKSGYSNNTFSAKLRFNF